MENFDVKKSDIWMLGEETTKEEDRVVRTATPGTVVYKPVMGFGKVEIERYVVLNLYADHGGGYCIVVARLRRAELDSYAALDRKVTSWKRFKFNNEMGDFYTRKEDAEYIARCHVRKISETI
jgi:hypothetical protein